MKEVILKLMLMLPLGGLAQDIAVSSFRLLEADLTANTAGTMERDQNGEVAALIKMVTTQTGFTFEGGAPGIVKTRQMPAEVWVYVPHGLKKITISHPLLGLLRDYFLPIPIQAARTYELVLATGTVESTIRQNRTSQYVLFKLTPPNAIVELDGELLQTSDGTAMKMMKFGTYTYRVQAPCYLPEAGNVTVDDPKNKHVVSIALKPDFATVTITVDGGAEIWVDGEHKGTGSWTGIIGTGFYELEARKQYHRSTSVTRDIVASSEPLTIHLQAPTPILGEVSIDSNPDTATVYIDNNKVGQTPLTVSGLIIGEHEMRLSRQGYSDYKAKVFIQEGEPAKVMATMQKNYDISVSCTNPSALLHIDGVEQGMASGQKTTTLGKHRIRLTANGWHEYTTTIDIGETERRFNFPMEKIGGPRYTVRVDDDVAFPMIRIDGGTLRTDTTSGKGTEAPAQGKDTLQATLPPYYIGDTEVTQAQWEAIMGKNPSFFKGSNKPVEQVSWEDCQQFIEKLNQKTGLKFRLPTEAEWEYAARGGNKGSHYAYSGSDSVDHVAWYVDNSGFVTHDVKQKQPNALGLYDMSGNVYEWCQDKFANEGSNAQPETMAPSKDIHHVIRGGSWDDEPVNCRVTRREGFNSHGRNFYLGFRLAL